MKKGIGKKNIAIIISLCLCLVLFLSFYIQFLNNEISNHIDETFNEVALQYQNHFSKELNNIEVLLESFVDDIVVDDKIEIEDNMSSLKRYCQQFELERIGVILNNKEIYSTDNKEYEYNNEEYFNKAFQGEYTYSQLITENNNKVLYISIPIEINNKIKGILFVVIDQEAFSKKMDTTSFDGLGYSYIVNNNGEMITYSSYNESTKDIDNIYDYILNSKKNDESIVDTLKDNLQNNRNGYIEFINGTDNYLHYSALDINDWNQILVVPRDSLNHTLYSVMKSTTIMVTVVVIILIMITGLVSKIVKKDNEELNEALYLDKLTGEDSFEKFYQEAEKMILNNHSSLAYVIVDINQFKLINDFYGYKEGDKTLCYLSSIIKERLQPGEMFGRRIADKFEILLKYQDKDILDDRLNELYETIKTMGKKAEDEFFVEPVMGICLIDSEDHDFIEIKNKAMIAHSFAKRKNDSDILYYQEDFKEQISNNKVLSDQLNVAYIQKEFIVYYQPKYDIHTKEIIGAEALVRWKKEDGTIIPPSVFIPLAESNGFIRKIDYEVFKQVCLKQKELLDKKKKVVPISVNVSRRVLKDDSFIDDYKKIIDEYNIPIEYIQLEITESALFENQENFLKIVKKLKEVGFKILMDDFGIGYSSLTMLEMLPIDIIKLDKAFVDHYKEVRGQAIMKSVIDLADSLDMGVIAEGVETEEQYHFLKDLSCYAIQGYYFSKPVDSDTYEQMIQG